MDEQLNTSRPSDPATALLCVIVDDQQSVRHFLSLISHGIGIDTVELPDGAALRAARLPRAPDIIFHNVSLDSADTIKSLLMLAKSGYKGPIQLISGRGTAVLEHVRSVGTKNYLNMLPILRKPFDASSIIKIAHDLRLGFVFSEGAHVDLNEAIENGWQEFWYQPIIDLRKKQLVGAEVFARIRHPKFGIVLPAGFMPNAPTTAVTKLSELAITSALLAGVKFSMLGLHLKLAVNVPADALEYIPIPDLVRAHRPPDEKWAGLILDLVEEQIIGNLEFAAEVAKTFEHLNVRLALDHFGRGFSSLTRLKNFPFAQIKLDGAFINNCGTDRVNAPLCRTMIGLAHNFGSTAVAIGIENATDALALMSMGCDLGMGYLLGPPMAEDHFVSLLRLRGVKSGVAPKAAGSVAPQAEYRESLATMSGP